MFGPNPGIRRWIRDLQRGLHAEFGRPTLVERAASVLAVGAAVWTGLTLKLNLFQHPRLKRTNYRLPDKRWAALHLWEEFPQKFSRPEFSIQVDFQHAKKQVWMRLEGALSAPTAERLAQRIHDSLAHTRGRLVLDLNRLHRDKVENLQPLRDKLAAYRSRIRLVLPQLSTADPELILQACIFEIVTTQVEHPAVSNTCRYLQSLGAKITYLPVNADGIVATALHDIHRAINQIEILLKHPKKT